MSFLTQRLRLTLNICYFGHGETDRSWLTCQLHVLIRYLQVFTQCFNNVQFCTVCVYSVIKSLVRVWLCTIIYLLNYVLTVSLSTNILLAALLAVCFWHFMLVGLGWHCWLVMRPVKTVGRIIYIVLVQTLNHAQSINQSIWHLCTEFRCTSEAVMNM